jgi:hypothetical protein
MPESSRLSKPGMSSPCARVARAGALALAVIGGPAGCGVGEIFTRIDVPESPGVADAPWPRLVDAPPLETLRAQAPDPAQGGRIVEDLSIEAAASGAEAERLSAPVFDAQTLRRDAEAVRHGR